MTAHDEDACMHHMRRLAATASRGEMPYGRHENPLKPLAKACMLVLMALGMHRLLA